jgi:cysteine synthase A
MRQAAGKVGRQPLCQLALRPGARPGSPPPAAARRSRSATPPGAADPLEHRDLDQAVAVEPAESPVLSGGKTGAHEIDGIGAGYVVPLWRTGLADQIECVSTDDAKAMAVRRAREKGIFAGTSTGANVVAALRLAAKLGSDAVVVSVMCDTGMKYLNN